MLCIAIAVLCGACALVGFVLFLRLANGAQDSEEEDDMNERERSGDRDWHENETSRELHEIHRELQETRRELHGIRRLLFIFVQYTITPPPPGTTPDELKEEIERVKAATAAIDEIGNVPPTAPV